MNWCCDAMFSYLFRDPRVRLSKTQVCPECKRQWHWDDGVWWMGTILKEEVEDGQAPSAVH